jgi:amino-acid N-acetyltransferase
MRMASARLVSPGGKLQPLPLAQNLRCHLQKRQKSTSKSHDERIKAKLRERQFFESVLSTSTTKREAKSFLSRFKQDAPKQPTATTTTTTTSPQEHHGRVNLGTLYSPYKAVEDTPVFSQHPQLEKPETQSDSKFHVAIVKIRNPNSISDEILAGVAVTLGQLARLGVISIVVVDVPPTEAQSHSLANLRAQCNRIAQTLESHHAAGARVIDQAFAAKALKPTRSLDQLSISLDLPMLVLSPLQRGVFPVISPVAYSESSDAHQIDANDIVLSLTTQFASSTVQSNDPNAELSSQTVLDRIIFLDDTGGLMDPKNQTQALSFVNLEQEYRDIHSQLLSDVLESGVKSQQPTQYGHDKVSAATYHLKTLECIKKCLDMLPQSSSALVATAAEVAVSADQPSSSLTGVRTRAKRNALIHNILTDKPMISSSLPVGRLSQLPRTATESTPPVTATVFKHGMPVTIVPDPRFNPWTSKSEISQSLQLNASPDIDFKKLKFLIEDSFNRPLDIDDYMNRVHNNLAGIIIAGDYEGGAILTWEKPPNRPGRPTVPYLDKFAVLKRSQGSGGVADIVFNAMVRDCFPNGVVWRSRKTNPVNKWYFERSTGTWQIPNSQWTMFWTGSNVNPEDKRDQGWEERLNDYVDVCRNVQPSWADTNRPPD